MTFGNKFSKKNFSVFLFITEAYLKVPKVIAIFFTLTKNRLKRLCKVYRQVIKYEG